MSYNLESLGLFTASTKIKERNRKEEKKKNILNIHSQNTHLCI